MLNMMAWTGGDLLVHFGKGHGDAVFPITALDILIKGGDALYISDNNTGELIYEK